MWSLTVGTGLTASPSFTTATRSHQKLSSETSSKPSKTMPSKCVCVLVSHLIRTLCTFAFAERLFPLFLQTSEYPVILSLENHCSVDQQKLMAHHLISILGDALVTKPLGDTMPTNFPSPEVCGLKAQLNYSYYVTFSL